jgi:formylglycine-generating enzyme required for sulfatase activity
MSNRRSSFSYAGTKLAVAFLCATAVSFAFASEPSAPYFSDSFHNGTGRGPEMVVLRAGEFMMGTYPDDPAYTLYTLPHRVVLSPFAMGRFSVTNREFADFLNDRAYTRAFVDTLIQVDRTPGLQFSGSDLTVAVRAGSSELPVTGVTWQGAIEYSRWLSKRTGQNYAIPTEAQWEYAARADSTTVWPWGDKFDPKQINCATAVREEGALPARSLKPNRFGLYGIPGNVWEWMLDCLDLTFYFHSPVHDPVWLQADCPAPMIRGGSFRDPVYQCSPGYRVNYFDRGSWDGIGFRVVRSIGVGESRNLGGQP